MKLQNLITFILRIDFKIFHRDVILCMLGRKSPLNSTA